MYRGTMRQLATRCAQASCQGRSLSMAEPVRVAAVVPWERLVDFAARAYEPAGVPPDQAQDAAEAIVDADGHGTTTHGLKNLRMYVTNLKEGRPTRSRTSSRSAARATRPSSRPTARSGTWRRTMASVRRSSWQNSSAPARSS